MTGPKRDARQFEMSDRQIAACVRFGRKITCWILDHDEIEGYVGGMDKFNYLILVPNYAAMDDLTQGPLVEKYLVHKGSTPLIELHDSPTLDEEPRQIRDELMPIVRPFRNRVMAEFYPEVPRNTPDNTQSFPED